MAIRKNRILKTGLSGIVQGYRILERRSVRVMRKKNSRHRLRWGRIGILLVALFALISYFLYNQHQKNLEERQIEANRQVLKAMEYQSVAEIEQRLREIRKEYGIGNISLDQIPNRKYFEDSVFMGDSLTAAISYYDLLPASNVVAAVGRNTMTAEEDFPLLKDLSPARLFLWYGINDLSRFDTAEAFRESYASLIDKIRAVQPQAEIVILSIQPVTEAASAKQPELKPERREEFNKALKALADQENILFIDSSGILQDSYYEPDGIHVTEEFYGKLFNLIKKEFIERQ